jgi:K+-transporting ATPase A subunit
MIHKLRPVLSLLIIYILLLSGGLLVLNSTSPELSSTTYATLLTIMTLITLGAYLLVITGTRKGDKDQGIWLLAGLGGKFLAYLVLVLIFWAVHFQRTIAVCATAYKRICRHGSTSR